MSLQISHRGPHSSESTNAVVHAPNTDNWQPIYHLSNQVVLYNPRSHALSIRHSTPPAPSHSEGSCPYCHRPFEQDGVTSSSGRSRDEWNRAANYFQLLEVAHESSSRPATPPLSERSNDDVPEGSGSSFPKSAMADGYFEAFFREEYKLGMGANGSVFLCQHVLNGNSLGHFAVKKIAVGESDSYLLSILREVRLLESLQHPNIITYHHAWLECCQFSSFGPRIPTLHVLMQWAEGGSLDDFISMRLGDAPSTTHAVPASHKNPLLTPTTSAASLPVLSSSHDSPAAVQEEDDPYSRAARIRAFRAMQRAAPEDRASMKRDFDYRFNGRASADNLKSIHLFSAEEVHSIFSDVVEGLSFLHNKSILHLDLKPGNVLLTWDDGRLIPRAMLSDFGTSRDMLRMSRPRSGNTGTLEYTAPETLPNPETGLLQQINSKADMWALGMILHKMLFFRLPYAFASETNAGTENKRIDRLEAEILSYSGFKSTQAFASVFETRRLPVAYLVLLEGLLSVPPASRPSCDRVAGALREGRLSPLSEHDMAPNATTSLIPVPRRRSSSPMDIIHSADIKEANMPMPDATTVVRDKSPKPVLGRTPTQPPWLHIFRSATGPRAIKSCLLVAKILTIPPFSEHRWLGAVLISLAVADSLTDNLPSSGILAILHIGAVKWMSWN